MHERRRFNKSERTALLLAADGRCAECGVELQPGWHADHIKPWSKDGVTDVGNGQALCPKCSLKKGSSWMELYPWQEESIAKFLATKPKDFLVAACPGAGKTNEALALGRRLFEMGLIDRISVAVPTDSLRNQWPDKAAAFGIHLMPREAGEPQKAGYHGTVVTYQGLLRGVGLLERRDVQLQRTLAILDEPHHLGEAQAWGDSTRNAYELATYRHLITGTPWRRPNNRIPFVEYDANDVVKCDVEYGYGRAVGERICRPVVFHAYDGQARYVDCGSVVETNVVEASEEELAAVFDSILSAKNSWMPTLIKEANSELEMLRQEVRRAAGAIIADGTTLADDYAEILKELTGRYPVVVHERVSNPKGKIDSFTAGLDPWLVAVRMVSEGVDIPRLAVGVYASRWSTRLFFNQVSGRFIRREKGDQHNAVVFIPAVPVLMKHASEIEDLLKHELDEERDIYERTQEVASERQQTFELRTPLSASDAIFDRSILSGDQVSSEEVAAARQVCTNFGIPENFAVNMAQALRSKVGAKVADVTVKPEPAPEPMHRYEERLKGEIKRLVSRLHHATNLDYKEINRRLGKQYGYRNDVGVAKLEEIKAGCATWLAEMKGVHAR